MYTKAKKTISHVTPQRPMTQEEQKQRIMQFLAQKRETFALAILQGICSNPEIHAKNPVEEARLMLGHESIATTTIYAQTQQDSVKISHGKFV